MAHGEKISHSDLNDKTLLLPKIDNAPLVRNNCYINDGKTENRSITRRHQEELQKLPNIKVNPKRKNSPVRNAITSPKRFKSGSHVIKVQAPSPENLTPNVIKSYSTQIMTVHRLPTPDKVIVHKDKATTTSSLLGDITEDSDSRATEETNTYLIEQRKKYVDDSSSDEGDTIPIQKKKPDCDKNDSLAKVDKEGNTSVQKQREKDHISWDDTPKMINDQYLEGITEEEEEEEEDVVKVEQSQDVDGKKADLILQAQKKLGELGDMRNRRKSEPGVGELQQRRLDQSKVKTENRRRSEPAQNVGKLQQQGGGGGKADPFEWHGMSYQQAIDHQKLMEEEMVNQRKSGQRQKVSQSKAQPKSADRHKSELQQKVNSRNTSTQHIEQQRTNNKSVLSAQHRLEQLGHKFKQSGVNQRDFEQTRISQQKSEQKGTTVNQHKKEPLGPNQDELKQQRDESEQLRLNQHKLPDHKKGKEPLGVDRLEQQGAQRSLQKTGNKDQWDDIKQERFDKRVKELRSNKSIPQQATKYAVASPLQNNSPKKKTRTRRKSQSQDENSNTINSSSSKTTLHFSLNYSKFDHQDIQSFGKLPFGFSGHGSEGRPCTAEGEYCHT